MYPYQIYRPSFTGTNFLKKISWSSFLDNTQRTLGIINQAIPVINQVKPIMNNARTMFKIADIMREDSKPVDNSNTNKSSKTLGNPIFYI